MRVLIDIDDNLYTRLFDNGVDNYDDAEDMAKSIRKGKPLPKEYGRMMILSEDVVKREQVPLSFSCQKWISEVGLSNATIGII